MTRLRRHLSYSNVVSTLALFLVLSTGVVYAANTIGSSDVIDESLLSQDIKDGEVKNTELGANSVSSVKIADGQVRTADVLNNNLTGTDIRNESLFGADVVEGTLGQVPQANNAGLLDSKDSTEFVQGTDTRIYSGRRTVTATSIPDAPVLVSIPNWGTVSMICEISGFSLVAYNVSLEDFDAYLDDGSADPSFERLSGETAEGSYSPTKVHTGDVSVDRVVWQLVKDTGGVATITASARRQDTSNEKTCHGAAQAVVRN